MSTHSQSSPALRVLDIVEGTIVDGPGLRTSIYLAGCPHHCPGCHNPQSWDPEGGTLLTVDAIVARVLESGFNVTLSGGDPLLQIEGVIELARRLRSEGLNVWCYTGYTIEQIRESPRLLPILSAVDTIVDGPFVEELRDISLQFRGSSNQRIIHLH
ncbi:MAG: anaerobic ribonucleoside-triphosphate reductase activating protein [Muribaculaceae bacterium]|nr:anaerobic ribonucleoside-triphosphate reductase activating protein [Muribaculaceae bacterium]